MLGLLILLVVWLMLGCAIAIGDNSRAAADINTDFKREVVPETLTTEEALMQTERKPK